MTVTVRIVRAVTYGSGPAWQPGRLKDVHPALAAQMVSDGDAEYVEPRKADTTIATNTIIDRTR